MRRGMRQSPGTPVKGVRSVPWHDNITSRRFLRYFLPLSIVSLALVIGLLAVSTANRTDEVLAEFARDQRNEVDTVGLRTSERLSSAVGDIAVLAQQRLLTGLSDDHTADELDAIADLFSSLAAFRPSYQQVRFLDVTGMERVRVDLDDGRAPTRVFDLQDKSGRYYFTSSIDLPPGVVYVSPVDLNVEFGEVEQPIRPMVRFGSTVVGVDGQLKGVVVLNQDARRYIDPIVVGEPPDDTGYLINDAGYWLQAPDDQLEWGFMFGRDDLRLPATDPQFWERSASSPAGQVDTDEGLYTFRAFNPLDDVETAGVSTDAEDGAFRWTIYSFVPPDTLDSIRDDARDGTLTLGVALAVIVLALSASTSYALGRRWLAGQTEREAAFVLDAAADGIAITDRNANLIKVNPAFTDLTGYSTESVLGRPAADLIVDLDLELVMAELRLSGHWSGRTTVRRADGTETIHRLAISRMVDRRGHSVRFVAVFNDVSAEVALEHTLERMATHDGLTGLANRPMIVTTIDQALARGRRTGDQVAVMFIDLDGFKQVNDEMGHSIGDAVLVEVANRISAAVRDADLPGRFGGDEFLIVLPDLDNTADLDRVAARVLESLAEQIITSDGPVKVGASIGISVTRDGHDHTADELIGAADAAMYKAKEQGGQRIAWVEYATDTADQQSEPGTVV